MSHSLLEGKREEGREKDQIGRHKREEETERWRKRDREIKRKEYMLIYYITICYANVCYEFLSWLR